MSNDKKASEESNEFNEIEIYIWNDNTVLQFNGERIGIDDNQWIAGKEQNRWNSVEIYKTENGKYVVLFEYQTRWQGEECTRSYETFKNGDELMEYARKENNSLLNGALNDAGMPIIIKIT